MGIRLDDEARRLLAVFSEHTGATAVDCLVHDDTVTFVVDPDGMADAIGPDGRTVRALEDRLDRRVILIERADRPEHFVANALAPAAVYDVSIQDGEAVASVDAADVGVAIGADGERIERARRVVARHFDIDDIAVESADR